MKILCQYKFKNNKSFRVELLETAKEIKKRGFNKPDHFALVFQAGEDETAFGLRPDEVVQLITLLSYGLYMGVKEYGIKLLKGYNGFKFKR